MGLMVGNPWNGGESGGGSGGGNTTIIVQGSQHYNVSNLTALNALTKVPNNSTAFITTTKTSYTFYNNAWIVTSKGTFTTNDITDFNSAIEVTVKSVVKDESNVVDSTIPPSPSKDSVWNDIS